jgi:hypothetical protein
VLALRAAAQGDDALCAKPPGRQHSAQANGAVPDHRDHVAFLHPGADRGVVPGRHHIGQGEQRPERLSGVSRSWDGHQRAAGERDADGFALAAVDLAVAETAAGNAGDGRPVQAVRAGHVAVDERGDHQITLADFSDQSMQLEGTPGQRMNAYYAQSGTPDHDAMILLDLAAREPGQNPPASHPHWQTWRARESAMIMAVAASAELVRQEDRRSRFPRPDRSADSGQTVIGQVARQIDRRYEPEAVKLGLLDHDA